jgi:hypothetical protein
MGANAIDRAKGKSVKSLSPRTLDGREPSGWHSAAIGEEAITRPPNLIRQTLKTAGINLAVVHDAEYLLSALLLKHVRRALSAIDTPRKGLTLALGPLGTGTPVLFLIV